MNTNSMANSKQRGRPKTSKSNRVKVSMMLDPDLKEWTEGKKRSDMVNRLLRVYKTLWEAGEQINEAVKSSNPFPSGGHSVGPQIASLGERGGLEYIISSSILDGLHTGATIKGVDLVDLINRDKNKPHEEQP